MSTSPLTTGVRTDMTIDYAALRARHYECRMPHKHYPPAEFDHCMECGTETAWPCIVIQLVEAHESFRESIQQITAESNARLARIRSPRATAAPSHLASGGAEFLHGVGYGALDD